MSKEVKETIIQKFIAERKMITEHYLKRVFVLDPEKLEGKELKSFLRKHFKRPTRKALGEGQANKGVRWMPWR